MENKDYKIINIKDYERREWFETYYNEGSARYNITVNIDITKHWKKVRLYPFIMYHLTKVMNRHDCFRTTINKENKLIIYNTINPAFTSFNEKTKHFKLLHIKWCEDYQEFVDRYDDEVAKYKDVDKFFVYDKTPSNYYNISMIPWIKFESFNLTIGDKNFLIPVFSVGKAFMENGKCYLPFAVSFNHSVCDGYHASILFKELQEEINKFKI